MMSQFITLIPNTSYPVTSSPPESKTGSSSHWFLAWENYTDDAKGPLHVQNLHNCDANEEHLGGGHGDVLLLKGLSVNTTLLYGIFHVKMNSTGLITLFLRTYNQGPVVSDTC
jgi:hypothetical protein